jgi:GMP synthase (glutamine-hydrolysing)
MTQKKRPRLLLLQIRDEVRVRQEEHESFAQYCELPKECIDIHNVFDKPEFGLEIVAGYDALLVGGASEASVGEPDRYPFVPASIALMRDCIGQGVPVFASCFGFQLAVLALGGTIIKDESGFEMGSIPISLHPNAAQDILMHDLPNPFMAIAVHRERSVECPPGAVELAFTQPCCHAFKVIDKPFWAFQFHPEVDRACLVERLSIFKEQYTDGDDHLEEVLAGAVETPWSNHLLRSFVERVVLA